jgi:carboxylate-amine ligase
MKEPAFTLGIEEEYLLVDRETRDLVVNPPSELFEAAKIALGDRVTQEFLRSQIEVGTSICATLTEARQQLREFRSTVAELAGRYGLAPLAASTHPFADWARQMHTDKERYNMLARD